MEAAIVPLPARQAPPARRARRRRPYGRVYRRPGGPGWLVQYPDPNGVKAPSGRTRYVTRSVKSREEGEALLAEIRKAVILGVVADPAEGKPATALTLLQAINEYLASKASEGRAEQGVRRYEVSRAAIAKSPLAQKLVTDLAPHDIEHYMSWRRAHKFRVVQRPGKPRAETPEVIHEKGKPISNATLNRDLALIAGSVNRLVRLDLLPRNPVKRVRRGREPLRSRVVLSKEEISRLLDACGPPLRLLAMAAFLTGQRPSELKAVRWGDVNLDDGTLTVFRKKVGLGGSIPLHPRLAAELGDAKKRRFSERGTKIADDEHVFLSRAGTPYKDYRTSWLNALKRAGLDRRPGLTFYSLRHSFATHFLEKGSPADLQALMGHASYSTTERYVRAVSERARAGVEAL